MRRVDEVGVGQEKFHLEDLSRIRPLIAGQVLPDIAEGGFDALQVIVLRLQALGIGPFNGLRQGFRDGQRVAVPGPGRLVLAHLVKTGNR